MATIAHKDRGHLPYPYGQVSTGQVTTDDELVAEILNALHHNSGVPQDRIRVEVRHGHAVLSGLVRHDFERELAEQVVAAAPGVIEVTNKITLPA